MLVDAQVSSDEHELFDVHGRLRFPPRVAPLHVFALLLAGVQSFF
jgi:hypothetical protein